MNFNRYITSVFSVVLKEFTYKFSVVIRLLVSYEAVYHMLNLFPCSNSLSFKLSSNGEPSIIFLIWGPKNISFLILASLRDNISETGILHCYDTNFAA